MKNRCPTCDFKDVILKQEDNKSFHYECNKCKCYWIVPKRQEENKNEQKHEY